MEILANILLGAGALGAAVYCYVLSARLKKFSTLEGGMGGAIAVLSAQVDDMTRALETARATAGQAAGQLEALTERAEKVTGKLEILVASMHDLPEVTTPPQPQADRRIRLVRRAGRRPEVEVAQ